MSVFCLRHFYYSFYSEFDILDYYTCIFFKSYKWVHFFFKDLVIGKEDDLPIKMEENKVALKFDFTYSFISWEYKSLGAIYHVQSVSQVYWISVRFYEMGVS